MGFISILMLWTDKDAREFVFSLYMGPGSSFILASCLIGKEAISSILLDQWARHVMSVSDHRSESSIRSYSKTDEATKKRISETLTSVTTSDVSSPLQDRQMEPVTLSLSPLLTLSQEERILADIIQHIKQSK